ncbi:MAG: SBBP repeat-containing protein [Ignavibacteriaceae bacterium]|nr:SBBP repeat-containing protein [Ignavibacteriaceae bacterium]
MKVSFRLFFLSLISLILLYNPVCLAQWSFNWTQSAGGNSDDSGQGISIDTSGNSYVIGSFRSTAMFGTIQLISNGWDDIFIAKYNDSGNCLWAKNVGSNFFDNGYGISTDATGNSYITGSFFGTVTFGTIQLTSFGDYDIFIAKYDSIGNCVWANNAGGIDSDRGHGISIDENGNCYMTGYFRGTALFGTTQLVCSGNTDVFVAKYDTSGNLTWVKNFGESIYDYSEGISADSNGNIFLTGRFVENPLPQFYDSDIFVAKYNALGDLIWIKTVFGNSDDSGQSISADEYGNSYVTGHFSDFAVFGTIPIYSSGYEDIFIAKYDAIGNCIWVKSYGGSEYDYGGYGISTDATGNSYITGSFHGNSADIIIAKYGTYGNLIWVIEAGGSLFDEGQSIATDGYGNIYVTGYFRDSAMFDTTQLVSAGGKDIFITKINTTVTSSEENLLPTEIQLHQNYPNPFNPTTKIKYTIPTPPVSPPLVKGRTKEGFVTLKVYGILGREIATLVNEEKPAGEYEVEFNAANLPSGIYFYQLKDGEFVQTRKMVLLK